MAILSSLIVLKYLVSEGVFVYELWGMVCP